MDLEWKSTPSVYSYSLTDKAYYSLQGSPYLIIHIWNKVKYKYRKTCKIYWVKIQ